MKLTIIKKNFPYFLILIPIISYWIIFDKYALNIPHWDDYAVRFSVEKLKNSPSFSEKINLLFAQHNEHRIFLTRLVAYFILLIKGEVDFKWLMFVGSLAFVGILIVFFKIFKKYNLPLLAFVPLPFILLTISTYENIFWGMASVQNFWVIGLAFICFYLLSQGSYSLHDKTFFMALFVCFLGIFTSSNGILIPIIGALLLLFQRKIKHLYLWIAFCACLVMAYFLTYQKPLDISEKANHFDLQLYAKGLFLTLGSGFEVYQNSFNREDFSMALGLFLGVFMVLFFYEVIFKKYNLEKRNNDLFLLACIAFIGITCLGITFGRISFGLGTLLSSKYKIYSILLMLIFYTVAVGSMAGKTQERFIKLSILGSVAFHLYSFFLDYDNIRFQHQERLSDAWNVGLSEVENILQKAKNSSLQDSLNIHQTPDEVKIEQKKSNNLSFGKPRNGFYVVLKSSKNAYIFPTKLYWQSKKDFISLDFIQNQAIRLLGFRSNFLKIGIQSDTYTIGILKIENENYNLSNTSQTIDIQEVKLNNSKQNW